MPTGSSIIEKNVKEDIIRPLEQAVKEFHNFSELQSLTTALQNWLERYELIIKQEIKDSQLNEQYRSLILDTQSSLERAKDKKERSNIRHTLRTNLKNLESENFSLKKEILFKEGIALLEVAREKLTGQHIDYIVEYSGFSSSNQKTLPTSPVILQTEDILFSGRAAQASSSRITLQAIQEGNFQKILAQTSTLQISKTSLSSHNDYLNALFQKQDSEDSFYRQSLAVFLESKKGQRLAKNNEGRFFEAVLHYTNLLKEGKKRPSMKQAISRIDNLPYYAGPDMIFKEVVNGQPKYRFLQAKLMGSATISFSTTYNGISKLSELLKDINNIDKDALENFLFGKSRKEIESTVDIIEQEAREIGIKYLENVLNTKKFKSLTQ